jgi:hypothetical protein
VNHNVNQQERKTPRARTSLLIAIALGCAFATVGFAQTPSVSTPTTPLIITPPPGHSLFLVGHAEGTQGYVCLPTGPGASAVSWTVKGARPEATLFVRIFGQDFQIITHF